MEAGSLGGWEVLQKRDDSSLDWDTGSSEIKK